jgi:hypothetical protein
LSWRQPLRAPFHAPNYPSDWPTICAVAKKLDIGIAATCASDFGTPPVVPELA